MSREVKLLSIFVASPGDVVEERDAVEKVVADLNASLCPPLGIRLDVLRWEKNVVPGFGVDPQDVVNRQIPNDYDIFVGILANRFGTPTKRAESGTAEEFTRAYDRFQNDPRSVELMIYFNEAPVNPSSIDPDQLGKVQQFRASLGPKGGLYRTYSNVQDFTDQFRNHLISIVTPRGNRELMANVGPDSEKSGTTSDKMLVPDTVEVAALPTVDDLVALGNLTELEPCFYPEQISDISDDYFGVLDHVEIFHTEIANLNEAMDELSELNKRFTEQLQNRTQEMNRIASIKDERLKVRDMKKSFEVTARLFDIYSQISERDAAKLAEARTKAFGAVAKAVEIFANDPNLDLEEFRSLPEQLGRYETAASEALVSMAGMKATVDELPNFSAIITSARNRLSKALDSVLTEFQAQQTSAADLRRAIEGLLDD